MNSYLFLLGNASDLATYELTTTLDRFQINFKADQIADNLIIINSSQPLPTAKLINTLGGTVKIAQIIKSTSQDKILSDLTNLIPPSASKITFSLNDLTRSINIKKLTSELKGQLLSQGQNSHFVILKSHLDSSFSQQTGYHELITIKINHQLHIAKLVVAQNPSAWSKRDYSRPASDPRSGMLPPKVARMMVNLAFSKEITPKSTIYDPFCGSGTILAEALSLGINVFGSDLSSKAIQQSLKNLNWLVAKFNLSSQFKLQPLDVTQLTPSSWPTTVDAIITEPYLGPPNINPQKAKDLSRGLVKLYIGSLKKFLLVLKPGGRVVMVFPRYVINHRVFTTSDFIDTRENFGYTRIAGPFTYARPQATVHRDIFVLTKN